MINVGVLAVRKHKPYAGLIGGVLLSLLSPLSFADHSADIFELSLDELMNIKVSIASKNAETIRKSPSSVTVFSKNDIAQMGITSWADLMNQVPGFYSMMNPVEGNQSHIIMRGHAQNYANTLLVLLNGHRLNEDYTGGINFLVRYMDLADVKQVEVIRGPGSAIYGSNAYSGVINILTQAHNNVELGVGELGAQKLLVSVAEHMAKWQLGATFSYYQDKGDLFTNVFDRNKVQTTTTDPHDVLQLRTYAVDDNSQFFAQFLQSTRDNYYLFRRLRDDVTTIKLQHLILGVDQRLWQHERLTVDLVAGYQRGARESLTALTPQGDAPFDRVDFLFGEDFTYRSANVAINSKYQLGDALLLNAGISYITSQVPESFLKSNFDLYGDFVQLPEVVTFNQDEQRIVLDKKRTISGAYAQAQWQINNTLSLTSGLRYDAYNDVDSALMPRLALVYQPDAVQTYKVLYGVGYRAPSLGDLYDEESGLSIGNQSLNASEIKSTEVVYSRSMARAEVTATIFLNSETNLIGSRPDGQGNQALANVASNNAQGIELEWLWQVQHNIRLKAAMTHLWRNDTTAGKEIGLTFSEDISPDTYLNFKADYQYQDWSFTMHGSWRSRVNVLNDGDLWLVNSNIHWQLAQDIKLSLNITNLFDTTYALSSYSVVGVAPDGNTVQQFPGRGRQALIKLSYHF